MSIINRVWKHVFVHVPKVAGTSMERLPYVGGNSHETARHLLPIAAKYGPFWSWGFVRNPYDRLVSVHAAMLQHSTRYPGAPPDFREYVRWIAERNRFQKLLHSRPMVEFLCGAEGQILVDFVGRFEQIAPDWETVCGKIGVPHKPLPHRNASRHPPWQECYDPETLATAGELYAADFATFGYDRLGA